MGQIKIDNIRFVDILCVDNNLKEKVRGWKNKERIRNFMLAQHIISDQEHLRWLEGLKQSKNNKFWVVYYCDEAIGTVQLTNIDHEQLRSEWGFYIGEDDCLGKGFAKKILYKLLELFFENMNFNTLVTKVLSDNAASLKIYNRFRFKETNKSPFDTGRDILTLYFTKDDWLKHKTDLQDECS